MMGAQQSSMVNEADEDSLVLIVGAPPTQDTGEYLPDDRGTRVNSELTVKR